MLKRSSSVKEVVHVKVKKYDGYYKTETKSFALDPHVTRFEDLRKIIQGAFTIVNFHMSYLCRDDHGENMFLSLLTEWDLDAAFMTSSEPYLRLKVDVDPFNPKNIDKCHTSLGFEDTKPTLNFTETIENGFKVTEALQVSKTWLSSVVSVINKSTFGLEYYENSESNNNFFPAKDPLDDAEFRKFMDSKGKILNFDDLWLRIYYSGIQPSLRKVAWRVLLNVFPQDLTGEQRIKYMKNKSNEYSILKDVWKKHESEDWVSQISSMVWKDVLRTDRTHPYFTGSDHSPNITSLHNILLTYSLTHTDISYCQGMSDIASPLLFVMDNEAHAYICFCSLMRRLKSNFLDDGTVMSVKFNHLALLVRYHDPMFFEYLENLSADSMYFCYRWLLLEMKREFSFENALTVLEVMWSSLPPHHPNENGLHLGSYNLNNFSNPLSLCAKSLNQLSLASHSESLNVENVKQTVSRQSSVSFIDCENHSNISGKGNVNLIPSGVWSCKDGKENPLTHKLEFKEAVFNLKNKESSNVQLPPPEVLGCGNPFLMFVCLSILLNEKDVLMSTKLEYDDLVMHFDKLVRKHDPGKVLSRAMGLFATYLKSHATTDSTISEI